ncbi:annexin A13 isoform X4 [Ovis aries]|uniref:annexin A13 isoform X4 n=1 Tax=Ovis aries TaxID=9940 RepID=UPI00295264A3|nr:annexin A13 isoform X4 [Ovis aries]
MKYRTTVSEETKMGNRHSQSYSLPEGSQHLPKGQALPSADLQPLSHPSGSGEPESHQPAKGKSHQGLDAGRDTKAKSHQRFDADRDAKKLNKACKGMGTDEAAIIEILSSRTSSERQQIKQKYKTTYGKEIIAIKEAYQRLFDKSLESDVKGDISGSLKRILVSLLQANRDEGDNVDKDLAGQDAKELYDAGEGRWGTDELAFNELLAKRSHKQLRATFEAYQTLIGKDIEEAIEAETSGDLQKAYLTLVRSARDLQGYFADRLYKSMKGAGTDEDTLIDIIVTRAEVDLQGIKARFQEKYQKSLSDMVRSDTSGDFQKLLVALLH